MSLFPFALRRAAGGGCRCARGGEPGGRDRREFLKSAAATIGAVQLAGVAPLFEMAASQDRNFAFSTAETSPVEGLIDTHLHGSSDTFGRATDEEFFELCKHRGIAGVVLKDHAAPTADRAWSARAQVPGIGVFGGIVLNSSVGGISPDAVNWMCRMPGGYGRFVWFPTVGADSHVKHFKNPAPGIKVFGSDEKLLPEVYDVLKICAKQRLVVNTGHLATRECLALIAAARDVDVDRIVVTHAESEIPNLSLEEMKKAAGMGAKLELIPHDLLAGPQAQSEWTMSKRQIRVWKAVDTIREIGARNFVLGSDLAQTDKPSPADALQFFVAELMAEGITMDEIKLMGREVPGALLMG